MRELLDLGGAEPLSLVKRHSRTLGESSVAYPELIAAVSCLAQRHRLGAKRQVMPL